MHFVGSPFRSASDACLKSIRQIKFYLFTVQGKKNLVDVTSLSLTVNVLAAAVIVRQS